MGYKILDTPEAGGAVLTEIEVCRIMAEVERYRLRRDCLHSFPASTSDQRPAIFRNSSS